MKSLVYDVFGQRVLISRTKHGWAVYYLGPEGKKRPARDIVAPSSIEEAEIAQYLGDLCHEWATEKHPDVKRAD